MLNTDQHSPNIRVSPAWGVLPLFIIELIFPLQKRMAFEDFQRNLRGVNGNSDFSPQYLVRSNYVIRGAPLIRGCANDILSEAYSTAYASGK